MVSVESNTHSFIVKIWLEEAPGSSSGRGRWRGRIRHVASSDQLYIRELDDIPIFIAPYLGSMGVKLGLRWSIRRWLGQVGRKSK